MPQPSRLRRLGSCGFDGDGLYGWLTRRRRFAESLRAFYNLTNWLVNTKIIRLNGCLGIKPLATGPARARLGSRGQARRNPDSHPAGGDSRVRTRGHRRRPHRRDCQGRQGQQGSSLLLLPRQGCALPAALEHVFRERDEFSCASWTKTLLPAKKLLRYVGAFFDFWPIILAPRDGAARNGLTPRRPQCCAL